MASWINAYSGALSKGCIRSKDESVCLVKKPSIVRSLVIRMTNSEVQSAGICKCIWSHPTYHEWSRASLKTMKTMYFSLAPGHIMCILTVKPEDLSQLTES